MAVKPHVHASTYQIDTVSATRSPNARAGLIGKNRAGMANAQRKAG
jgi:hypothetical protein